MPIGRRLPDYAWCQPTVQRRLRQGLYGHRGNNSQHVQPSPPAANPEHSCADARPPRRLELDNIHTWQVSTLLFSTICARFKRAFGERASPKSKASYGRNCQRRREGTNSGGQTAATVILGLGRMQGSRRTNWTCWDKPFVSAARVLPTRKRRLSRRERHTPASVLNARAQGNESRKGQRC